MTAQNDEDPQPKTYQTGAPPGFRLTYPVTADNFPPAEGANLVSPRIGKPGPFPPPLPADHPEQAERLNRLINLRAQVCRGEWPTGIDTLEPNTALGRIVYAEAEQLDIPPAKYLAEWVRMDHWSAFSELMIADAKQYPLRPEFRTASFGHNDLVGHIGASLVVFGAVHAALTAAFDAKWYYGPQRPAEAIGLPKEVFTAYGELPGGTGHPEEPCGHPLNFGAAIGAILGVWQIPDHTADSYRRQGLIGCLGRAFAGVHYIETCQDSYDHGLTIGTDYAAAQRALKCV